MVQWLRIFLAMQGTRIAWLVGVDATCHGSNLARVSQLSSQRYGAREPKLLSPHTAATEACVPTARAPLQEPSQGEARA